jgi:hypothetical protein
MKRLFATRAQAAGTIPPPTAEVPSPDSMLTESKDTNDIDLADEPTAQAGFQEITQSHAQSAAEDETDRAPVTASTIIGRPISLQQLFDLVMRYEKPARRSFDEELELLDLDGAGEECVDIDLDDWGHHAELWCRTLSHHHFCTTNISNAV